MKLHTPVRGRSRPTLLECGLAGATGPGPSAAARTAVLFTGADAPSPALTRALYGTFPAYRSAFDTLCRSLDARLPMPLVAVVFAPEDGADARLLREPPYARCALFGYQIALFRLWESWGLGADAVAGGDGGLVAAAHVAGSLTAEEAARLLVAGPEEEHRCAFAGRAHAAGVRGDGVRVVMVDTGLYDHPHHRAHGYRTSVVPALSALDPAVDERGHGTAMSALLLAVAPAAELTMVKMACETFSFPVAAFQRAVELAPDVISCSWGTLRAEPHLHLEVADAVRRGITVLFAAGNGSTDRRTAMFQSVATPGALTVGGVHVAPDGRRRAADLASSYRSDLFPGRRVPDLSGPCGMLPHGDYVEFPTQPGCMFDRRNSAYDGTAPDDGWLVSSGTSGATAYAAGVVALAVQQGIGKGRALTAADLADACLPVTEGRTLTGDDCGGVCPNEAVGLGLLTTPV
ncbi:S8 family serine peptidase [Streptomyces albidoflavus]|nr:S8 family serine peptidase [Streptomyces albidoflavus]